MSRPRAGPARLASLAACGLLAGAAAAQPAPPVFSSQVEVVKLTVVARDRDGTLVTDLGREDFTVLENGRPQRLSLFARAVEPGQEEVMALDLGLLMDTSQSMLAQLRLSQQAAVRFLDAIPRARDLLTVFFDQDIKVSRYDSESQQGLIERLQSVSGGGNTALYDAIAVYLSRVADAAGGRKVAVLFTDGEDSISATSSGEAIDLVRSSGVTVYAIAFADSLGSRRATQARAFLGQVTAVSGGEVFSPRGARELPAIYEAILDQLKAQYVLGFVSDDPTPDGKFRKLKVLPARKDLRLRHREGYFAAAAAAASR
jgi:Ca-activated chloride channel family protein